jgi:hypothetical protein
MGLSYQDILRAWLDTERVPLFEHAWLWDHMVPLGYGPRMISSISVAVTTSCTGPCASPSRSSGPIRRS